MIPYTLTTRGKEEARQIRTDWREVTLAAYIPIVTAGSPLEAACLLCGLSESEYAQSGGALDTWISHALQLAAEGPRGPRPDWLPADLGRDTIGRFELAKKYLQKVTEHHAQAYPYLYAIYAWPQEYDALDALIGDFPTALFWRAAGLPVTEVIAVCAHVLAEVVRLTEKHSEVLATPPTIEETQAGVARFEKYGFYPTLLSYAGGDVTRLREVLQVEAGVLLHSLCVDTEKAAYERAYQEVMANRK